MKKLNDKSKSSLDNFPDKLSPGVHTSNFLKAKKIKSPKVETAIKIKHGFWVVPKTPINTQKQLKNFIDEQIKKFKLS